MTHTASSLSRRSQLFRTSHFLKNSSKSLRIALVLTVLAMAFATTAFAAPSNQTVNTDSLFQQQIIGQPHTSEATTDGHGHYTFTYHINFVNHWNNKVGVLTGAWFRATDNIDVTSITATPIGNAPINSTYTGGGETYPATPAIVGKYSGDNSTYVVTWDNSTPTAPDTITDGSTYTAGINTGNLFGYSDTESELMHVMPKNATWSYLITVKATEGTNVPSDDFSPPWSGECATASQSQIAVDVNVAVAGQFDTTPWGAADGQELCTDLSTATVVAPTTTPVQSTPTTPTVSTPPVSTPTPTTPVIQQPTNPSPVSPVAHDGATGVSGLQLDKTPQQAQAQTPAGSQLTVQTPAATPAVTPAQTGNPAQTSLYNENASASHVATQTPSSAHRSATSAAKRNDGLIQLSNKTTSQADGFIHLSNNMNVSKAAASGVLPASLLAHHSAKHNYSLYAMWAFLVTATAMYLFVGVRKYRRQPMTDVPAIRVHLAEVELSTFPVARNSDLHIVDVYGVAESVQAQRVAAQKVHKHVAESVVATAALPKVMSIGVGVPVAKRKVTMPSIKAIAAAGSLVRLTKPLTSRIARAYATRSESAPSRFDFPVKIWNELTKRQSRQKVEVSSSTSTFKENK